MPPPRDIAALLVSVEPLSPQTTVAVVGDIFLREESARMLSLPVVDDGRVVGSISRSQLISIFLRPFGREIYGPRKISSVMNTQPLAVDITRPLEEAAQYVADHIPAPLTEDFVIVGDDGYRGMGVVLDLLREMERRVALSNQQLVDANAQLKSSQAQLVQSEKMASLGQMVAGIAHEINTPLGYVRNNVEMMQGVLDEVAGSLRDHDALLQLITADTPDDSAVQGQIERLLAARNASDPNASALNDAAALIKDTLFGADQIKELVLNLRNFTRLDLARVADVDLNECLEQTLVIARNVLKHKVEVIKRYGVLPKVRCSPSQVNQVLLNLINNAVQAIEHDRGRLLLQTEVDDERVIIKVQDNGKGIAPEHLKKIFDPFFTTKPVGQGTGLGLSICYQIIQAHGGKIQAVSEVGRGTRFTVMLPRQSNALTQPPEEEALAA